MLADCNFIQKKRSSLEQVQNEKGRTAETHQSASITYRNRVWPELLWDLNRKQLFSVGRKENIWIFVCFKLAILNCIMPKPTKSGQNIDKLTAPTNYKKWSAWFWIFRTRLYRLLSCKVDWFLYFYPEALFKVTGFRRWIGIFVPMKLYLAT